MANDAYDAGKEALMNGEVDLADDDIRAILVDTDDYTVSLSTHTALDDIPAGARVATSGNLANKSTTDGTFDADDETLSSVTGDESEAIVIYKHTGTESTSTLLFYYDTFDSGMPVTPNGGDIDIQFGASGIAYF